MECGVPCFVSQSISKHASPTFFIGVPLAVYNLAKLSFTYSMAFLSSLLTLFIAPESHTAASGGMLLCEARVAMKDASSLDDMFACVTSSSE